MKGGNRARIIFWSLFLPAALAFGIYAWNKGIRQQCAHQMYLMAHPNAKVASKAWNDLNRLYMSEWKAYDYLVDHVDDPRPIHFLVEAGPAQYPYGHYNTRYFEVHDKPIFYKTNRVYCRTVGEAVLAMIYNEGKGRRDLEADWQTWWEANRGWYGRP